MARRALVLFLCGAALALDNGVGLTPAMGYNTWNDFRCGSDLNASAVRALADAMVQSGLAAKGYTYLNVDDCWTEPFLSPEGRLIESATAFPEGIGSLAAYVHSKGLKFGLYADRGWKTCAFRPGSGGNERMHASQLAEWGVDYLKHDSCWASSQPERAFQAYAVMRDALNATGRPILYSLCGWNAWYAPMGATLANSWRIAPDCDEWANVYVAIRTNEKLALHVSPGSFNDPDMLLGSNPDAPASLTPAQVQAQFSMWAVMAAPLLIGSRLLSMPPSDFETYSNEEVIAINQDPLGVQGTVVWSNCPPFEPRDNWWMSPWSMPQDVAVAWITALATIGVMALASAAIALRFSRTVCAVVSCVLLAISLFSGLAIAWYRPQVDECQQIWSRPLSNGDAALAMINFAFAPARITCGAACLRTIFPQSAGAPIDVRVRDVVARKDVMGLEPQSEVALVLQADGGSALFRLTPGS
mmetsp:Transcript_621/g.2125  ORF Transcript_621/g.2125 Transcript_621/m.2125 type:complete len:472 (+) Transcript_621:15-1430(+)